MWSLAGKGERSSGGGGGSESAASCASSSRRARMSSRAFSVLRSTRSVLSDQSANGSWGSAAGGGASGARPKGHPQWKQKFDAPGFGVPQRSHGFVAASDIGVGREV